MGQPTDALGPRFRGDDENGGWQRPTPKPTSPKGKGLTRQCPAAADPPYALPGFGEGERPSELAAQCHAVSTRFAGEADEQLVRGARQPRRGGRRDGAEGAAAL